MYKNWYNNKQISKVAGLNALSWQFCPLEAYCRYFVDSPADGKGKLALEGEGRKINSIITKEIYIIIIKIVIIK